MGKEGLKPYTPSRIEWLELLLNAENFLKPITTFKTKNKINVIYRGIPEENTIVIRLVHSKELGDQISDIIQSLRNKVLHLAKFYGWDTWIRIKEVIEVIENEEDSNSQNN